MNRRIVRNGAVTVACALTLMAALAACKNEVEDAPTCDDLQQEANGCKTSTQAEKDQFARVGATCKAQVRFSADCRKCLSGKVCGVTEPCDPLCGK